jgi:hypothetical protein
MVDMEILTERIGQASGLIGLLLALVTLFTSEQSRALDAERRRVGGSTRGARRRIVAICTSLAVLTLAALFALAPLVLDVCRALVEGEGDPLLIVFALVWLLLVPLVVWQLAIVLGAGRLGRS